MEQIGKVCQSVKPSDSSAPRTRSEARVMARMPWDQVEAVTDRFLNSFRNDPDLTPQQAVIQAEGIARIFAAYPPEVVHEVTDLVRGLPSRQRFFPSLDEVKSACEAAIAPLHRAAARDVAIVETQARLGPPPLEPPEDREATVKRLWIDSGLRENMAQPEKKAPKPQETAAETLARTSGLPISEVLAKLDEVPDKPLPPAA